MARHDRWKQEFEQRGGAAHYGVSWDEVLALDPSGGAYLGWLLSLRGNSEHPRAGANLAEDGPKLYAYLWAVRKLQNDQIPLSLSFRTEDGTRKPLSPAALYRRLAEHREILASEHAVIQTESRLQFLRPLFDEAAPSPETLGVPVCWRSDDGRLVLYDVRTVKHARIAGAGTQWCSADKDGRSAARKLLAAGNLFPLWIDNTPEFQLHFSPWQLKDPDDEDATLDEMLACIDNGHDRIAVCQALADAAGDDARRRGGDPDLGPLWAYRPAQVREELLARVNRKVRALDKLTIEEASAAIVLMLILAPAGATDLADPEQRAIIVAAFDTEGAIEAVAKSGCAPQMIDFLIGRDPHDPDQREVLVAGLRAPYATYGLAEHGDANELADYLMALDLRDPVERRVAEAAFGAVGAIEGLSEQGHTTQMTDYLLRLDVQDPDQRKVALAAFGAEGAISVLAWNGDVQRLADYLTRLDLHDPHQHALALAAFGARYAVFGLVAPGSAQQKMVEFLQRLDTSDPDQHAVAALMARQADDFSGTAHKHVAALCRRVASAPAPSRPAEALRTSSDPDPSAG